MKSTIKLSNKLFTLIILIVVLFSLSCVFAEDNATVSDVISMDDNGVEIQENSQVSNFQESGVEAVLAVSNDESVLEASNTITVHVLDAYNKTGNTWTEDGVDLSGATVKLYDSSNKPVSTLKTNSKGIVTFKNLNSAKYHLVASYSTYNPINIGEVDFMNMSRRVAYISTTNFDESRAWLADYAKFIHIDMFADNAAYNKFSPAYLKSMLKYSPANINYNVAYTFGVYSQQILDTTGIHIVGANSTNNTFVTIENTYIGSYFQADDIKDSVVLVKNMRNYFDYVLLYLNPN